MARYTTTQEIAFNDLRDERLINVNGSVAVEMWDSTEYITDVNSPLVTGSYRLFTKGAKFRFTPTGGSSFWLDEGTDK
jgi:hypothetical protein